MIAFGRVLFLVVGPRAGDTPAMVRELCPVRLGGRKSLGRGTLPMGENEDSLSERPPIMGICLFKGKVCKEQGHVAGNSRLLR